MEDVLLAEVRALKLAVEKLKQSVERGGDRPQAYRLEDAAQQMGFKLTFLKKRLRSGEINSVKSGRVRLVTAKEIDRWLTANTTAPSTRVQKTRGKTEGEKIRASLKKKR